MITLSPVNDARAAADDRRLRVLAHIHHAITTEGAPPTARTLAHLESVSVRTAVTDVDTLVTAGLLHRFPGHVARQRSRLGLTPAGKKLLPAPAPSDGTPPGAALNATLPPSQAPWVSQAHPPQFSHAHANLAAPRHRQDTPDA